MDEKDNISEDDQAAWEFLTRDVVPIKREKPLGADKPARVQPKTSSKPKRNPSIPTETQYKPIQSAQTTSTEIDARTNDRLRKGQIPIEARLDMHGMTQPEARHALVNFIQNAHMRSLRCVLVITGKGQKNRDPLAPHEGVLKSRFPEWISEAPMNTLILKTHSAKPKDGGNGAFYVLLRRRR